MVVHPDRFVILEFYRLGVQQLITKKEEQLSCKVTLRQAHHYSPALLCRRLVAMADSDTLKEKQSHVSVGRA